MWRQESRLARNLRPLKQQSSELFLFLCYLPQQKLAFSRKGAAWQDSKLLNEHCALAKYHTKKTVAQSPAMAAGAQLGSLDFHPHEAIIRCQPLPWGGQTLLLLPTDTEATPLWCQRRPCREMEFPTLSSDNAQ